MHHSRLDADDRRLVAATQAGLPISAQPFNDLAKSLTLSSDDVLGRLQRLQDLGVIRRIAPVPNHYRLGYTANGMSVWDVEDNKIQACGQLIGGLDFVSHCYHRPRHLPGWPYNLFAMVHGKNKIEVQTQVAIIAEKLGDNAKSFDVLFSKRILKKTGFRISP